MSLSDRIVLMNAGVIEQAGRPDEIYAAPATTFAADFIGAANVMPAMRRGAVAELAGGGVVDLAAPGPDGPGHIVLRQEDLWISASTDVPGTLTATVITRVYRGADVVYVVEVAGQRLRVVVPRQEATVPLGPAVVGWRGDSALWIPTHVPDGV